MCAFVWTRVRWGLLLCINYLKLSWRNLLALTHTHYFNSSTLLYNPASTSCAHARACVTATAPTALTLMYFEIATCNLQTCNKCQLQVRVDGNWSPTTCNRLLVTDYKSAAAYCCLLSVKFAHTNVQLYQTKAVITALTPCHMALLSFPIVFPRNTVI